MNGSPVYPMPTVVIGSANTAIMFPHGQYSPIAGMAETIIKSTCPSHSEGPLYINPVQLMRALQDENKTARTTEFLKKHEHISTPIQVEGGPGYYGDDNLSRLLNITRNIKPTIGILVAFIEEVSTLSDTSILSIPALRGEAGLIRLALYAHAKWTEVHMAEYRRITLDKDYGITFCEAIESVLSDTMITIDRVHNVHRQFMREQSSDIAARQRTRARKGWAEAAKERERNNEKG